MFLETENNHLPIGGNNMAKNLFLTFTMEDGTIYEVSDNCYKYCYKTLPNGQKSRVSKVTVENAYAEYKDSEWGKEELEAKKQAKEAAKKSDAKAENKVNKPRKSKDVAFEACGKTLTAKQVTFLKALTKDDFWGKGVDSALYIESVCDTVAEYFNPMAVGAMVSTLREKGLMNLSLEVVDGKKVKWIQFTQLGKQVAKELGLE
jgi:hypothetical protein